jgi:hypothetical protein
VTVGSATAVFTLDIRCAGLRREDGDAPIAEVEHLDDVARRFEAVTATLSELDVEALWAEATEQERRVLLDELLQDVTVLPDHLQVTVHGAPALNVTLEEFGLGQPGEDWSCRRNAGS